MGFPVTYEESGVIKYYISFQIGDMRRPFLEGDGLKDPTLALKISQHFENHGLKPKIRRHSEYSHNNEVDWSDGEDLTLERLEEIANTQEFSSNPAQVLYSP